MDTEDLPDFLGGEPAPEPQAAPAADAPAPAAAAPAAEGPARGADGKFAAAAPAPAAPAAPAPNADAAPAAPAGEPVHHVPLATFLDTRDKLSAAEKEAKELREWRQQQEEAARRQQVQAPNRDTDPQGYERFQQAQIGQALYGQRLEMSRGFAEMKHGPDVTTAAFDWGVQRCDADPFFNEKVRAHRDPVGFVVSEWQREQTLAQMSDPKEIEAFRAWKAQQAGQPAGQPHAAAPPAAPAAPRQSLAASPSAGASAGPVPQDGEAIFNEMFGS